MYSICSLTIAILQNSIEKHVFMLTSGHVITPLSLYSSTYRRVPHVSQGWGQTVSLEKGKRVIKEKEIIKSFA